MKITLCKKLEKTKFLTSSLELFSIFVTISKIEGRRVSSDDRQCAAIDSSRLTVLNMSIDNGVLGSQISTILCFSINKIAHSTTGAGALVISIAFLPLIISNKTTLQLYTSMLALNFSAVMYNGKRDKGIITSTSFVWEIAPHFDAMVLYP
ncbi:hypothetical protein SLA2020_041570 [Shorea laevis]